MKNELEDMYWYNEENYNYIRQYVLGKISIKDVPLENLNEFILAKAAKKEPDVLMELLLSLNEKGNYTFDALDGFRLISNEYRKDEYYYRYFLLNPLEHYLKIPKAKTTMQMVRHLMLLNPENIKYLLEKHKTKEMCMIAFQADPGLVRYMPDRYIDDYMYEAYIKQMALSVKVDINDAVKNEYNENWEKYLSFLRKIPVQKRPNDLYAKLFKLNPLLFVAFGDWNKTYEMCVLIYKNYGYLLEKFIPHDILWAVRAEVDLVNMTEHQKRQYYYEKFKADPINLIDVVPLEYRTQKFYNLLFKVGKVDVLNKIPIEYRTQEMWNLFVLSSNNIEILQDVPDEYITQEMCDYLYKIFGMDSLYYIPNKYINKEMFLDFLNNKLYMQMDISFNFLTVDMLDEGTLSKFVIYLRRVIKEEKTIDISFNIFKFILNLYPSLIKAFDQEYVRKIVVEELCAIILNGGTIEGIAKKYDLSVSYVDDVLESIKLADQNSYNLIKNILEKNQNKWFYSMLSDIENLNLILSSMGEIRDNRFDMIQKVKFSYLYSKYIQHSLEDIYRFNYKKYINEDCSLIDNFFKKILKYSQLHYGNNSIIDTIDIDTIELNNSWLRKYDRNKFFAVKNGVATMERRYGKDAKLLTLDIEKEVISELNLNGIPLMSYIVESAFREYFKGNLDGYIKQIKEFDLEIENVKRERMSK